MDIKKQNEAMARLDGMTEFAIRKAYPPFKSKPFMVVRNNEIGWRRVEDYTDLNVLHRIVRGMDETKREIFHRRPNP